MRSALVCWKDAPTQSSSSTAFVQSAASTPESTRGHRLATEDDRSLHPRSISMLRARTEEEDVLEVHERKSDSAPCCSLWSLWSAETPPERTRCDSSALGEAVSPASDLVEQHLQHERAPPSGLSLASRQWSVRSEDPWVDPQEDGYDPRLPEYMQMATKEEVAASTSSLLARQIKALRQSLEWRQAPGRITPNVKRHYEQVIADMRGRFPPQRPPEPRERFSSDEEGEEHGSELWERGSDEARTRRSSSSRSSHGLTRWRGAPQRPGQYFADPWEDDMQPCAEASSSRSRPTPQADGDNATSPSASMRASDSRASDLHSHGASAKTSSEVLNQTSSAGSLQISVRDDDEWVVTQTVDWSSEHSSNQGELEGSLPRADKPQGVAAVSAHAAPTEAPRSPTPITLATDTSQFSSPAGGAKLSKSADSGGEKQRCPSNGNSTFSFGSAANDTDVPGKKRRSLAKGASMVDICSYSAAHDEDEDIEEAADSTVRGCANGATFFPDDTLSQPASSVHLPHSSAQSPSYQQLPHSGNQSPVRQPQSASQSPASLGGVLSGSSSNKEFGSCRELESCYERDSEGQEHAKAAHVAERSNIATEMLNGVDCLQLAHDQHHVSFRMPPLPEADTGTAELDRFGDVSMIRTRQRSVAGGDSMFDLVGYDAAEKPKYCEDESTVSAGSGLSSNLTGQESATCCKRANTLSTDDSEHRHTECEQQSEQSDRQGSKAQTAF